MNRISDVEISDAEEDLGLGQLSTANNNGEASGSGIASGSGVSSSLGLASGSGAASGSRIGPVSVGSSGGVQDREGDALEASENGRNVEGMQFLTFDSLDELVSF